MRRPGHFGRRAMIHDLFFVGCLGLFFMFGLWRPFLFVLTFIYIDLVTPQQLTYALLQPVPVSLIGFALAFGGWLVAAKHHRPSTSWQQGLMLVLMLYCLMTTLSADFPVEAQFKWDWVWKAMLFALFLPLTLTTRLRIEAVVLTMVLSVSVLVVPAGVKTLLTGGGYQELNLLAETNAGLHESSILACAAIMLLPLLRFLSRDGKVFAPGPAVRLYALALGLACLLVTVGTQARTGMICILAWGLLRLRSARHRSLYLAAALGVGIAALPLLPQSFMDRMATIEEAQADQSAATRLAVWKWTLDYAASHPFGGGFAAYLGNNVRFEVSARANAREAKAADAAAPASAEVIEDKARAFHSAYFEMLGEQGWPGLSLWLLLHALGLVSMERLYRRHRPDGRAPDPWTCHLAQALQQAHIIYLVGALFVGIAFLPVALMLVGLEAGFYAVARRTRDAGHPPLFARAARPLD
ncbi:MAG: putative O-glycosylation ligase, exosortase A system-associated [Chakrabartia sp.]